MKLSENNLLCVIIFLIKVLSLIQVFGRMRNLSLFLYYAGLFSPEMPKFWLPYQLGCAHAVDKRTYLYIK